VAIFGCRCRYHSSCCGDCLRGTRGERCECPHVACGGALVVAAIAPAASRYSPQSAAPRKCISGLLFIIAAQGSVIGIGGEYSNLPRVDNIAEKVIMANVSKLIFGAAIAVVAAFGIEKPTQAQSGGWCAYFDEGGGGGDRECGFATLQQCLADVRGVGGNCSPSPYYEAPNYYRYPPGYPY
jgi:Protein of unknown function (DUF3551)